MLSIVIGNILDRSHGSLAPWISGFIQGTAFPCSCLICDLCCRFKDKEVQRDAKMVSYKVVDKAAKPYVEVTISDEKKVITPPSGNLITITTSLADIKPACMVCKSKDIFVNLCSTNSMPRG